MTVARIHGGPDAQGVARWDFSTCSHPLGPHPLALLALAQADPRHYPDPSYAALRQQLADFHGVAPARLLLAASASEFIQRVTAVGQRLAPGAVAIPQPAYGDYAAAAQTWGRGVVAEDAPATLRWAAELRSPDGLAIGAPTDCHTTPTVLDRAYGPLRLSARQAWGDAALRTVFQLFTPNKALGLCGVRAAYAIAPDAVDWDVEAWCAALRAAEPSWVLGAHGVSLLQAWCQPRVQQSLLDSLPLLSAQRAALVQALAVRGFGARPGDAPFGCLRVPVGLSAVRLREHGVAVRDCSSFGLPGHWRLNALGAEALDALLQALDEE
ncbi:histidinol-phosphate aminotransferase [Inhella inkyongensis]|uniref:Histidinol-phosphate aminotransferase n=1 Tax=Inhella inkyongensis TaxID=392593 RepID=A0A840S5J1_9BURK|nr:aminotransferase class I/II-fold pyridoxal phosphate-dependent enzyme [Inhella inkyongensis]MBB5204842.1 histidinol-phosphate aminotransferase [Inhella inkyongensis]